MNRLAPLLALGVLVLSSFALAEQYALYSGDTVELPEGNLTFTLYMRSNADFDSALAAYNSAKKTNVTSLIDQAYNDSLDALAAAKSDDQLYITTPWRTFLVPYDDCRQIDKYTVCFDTIMYLEEDSTPLGDGRLDTVKVEGGETYLPFTVSVDEAVVDLVATRTFSPTTVYPGDTVFVQLSVINQGVEPASSVSVTEYPPLSVSAGDTSDFVASLQQFDQLLLTYRIIPKIAGDYVFTGEVKSANSVASLPDSTLVVQSPVALAVTIPDAFVGEETIATVNVTNTYNGTITITDIEFSNDEAYAVTPDGLNPRYSFDLVELDLQESYSTTLGYSGDVAGRHAAQVLVSYTADKKQTAFADVTYARKIPNLILSPAFSGVIGGVTILNDAPTAVDGITITFSDGFTRSLARVKPLAAVTVDHQYAIVADTDAWVEVTHPSQQGRSAFSGKVTGRLTLGDAPPVTESPPAEAPSPDIAPPETPQAQGQPTQMTEPVPAGAATKGEDGGFFASMVKGFVSFIESIFS